jgi:Raf kinase inhibitor-like YbhB/YbcL family protein
MRGAVLAAGLVIALGVPVDAVAAKRFTLSSPAFAQGRTIPIAYTCDGRNVSPALRWTAPPKATRSFALIMDDPDAPSGTFTHWLAWSIPAGARRLVVGQRPLREGTNGAGRIGYVGPCPPSGTHRYVFRLYALRTPIHLARGAARARFSAALRGKVVGTARLVGRYSR